MSEAAEGGGRVTVRPVVQAPIWKHLLWGAVALVGLWALSKIPSTLIVFSMAWLIAYLLNPAVDYLSGKKVGPVKSLSRGQAVGLVAGLLLGALIAAGAMLLPQLTEQVEKLISLQTRLGNPQDLPIIIRQKVEPLMARVPEQYREELMARSSNFIQESASKIGAWASAIVTYIGAFIAQLFSAIFLVCSAFLVSLYILMNWHTMAGDFLEKLPRQYRREVRSLSLKLNEIFGGYLKATILTAIACMIATFVFLLLLTTVTGKDFPYKGLVAFVAGISYPVPVIGIIATSILGGVLGFVTEGSIGFGVLVLVTINVVNIIIDRTVQPRLMSDAIGVSELFVMFAAFAGGEVAGVWGMLLGIPVAAMGKTLFEWFHLNFLLVEEPAVTVGGESPSPTPALEEPAPAGVTAPAPAPPLVVEPKAETRVEVAAPAPSVTPPATLSSTAPEVSPPAVVKGSAAAPNVPQPQVVVEAPAPGESKAMEPPAPEAPVEPKPAQAPLPPKAVESSASAPVEVPEPPAAAQDEVDSRTTRRLQAPPPLPPGPPAEAPKKKKRGK